MNSGLARLTTTSMGTIPVRGVVPLSVAVMVNWYSRGIRMEEFATNIIPDVTALETDSKGSARENCETESCPHLYPGRKHSVLVHL